MAMPKIITREEVQTYANALIVQYIEKHGVSDLSQLSPSKKSTLEKSVAFDDASLPPINNEGDTRVNFDTVLESIIYSHLCRAYDDQDIYVKTHQRIQIQNGISIPFNSPTTDPDYQNRQLFTLPEVRPKFVPSQTSPSSRHRSPQARKRPTTTSNSSFRTPTKKPTPKDESAAAKKVNARGSMTVSPFQKRKSKGSKSRGDERPQTAPCSSSFTLKSLGGSHPSRLGKSRSIENWIPDHIREKMVQRDLSVAKQNLQSNELYNRSSSSSIDDGGGCGGCGGADGTSPLERSRAKEKFGLEQRKPCGLCCMLFLPVNLVMAVPLKAVFDMRDTWGSKFDPEGQAKGIRVNPNLKRAPACYDRTRVCAFCAQLFDQQQETYRPRWEARAAEKERLRMEEEAVRKMVMSDPLKQCDAERADDVNNSKMDTSGG